MRRCIDTDVREKLVELIQNSHKKCKAMKSCYECEQYGNSSDCVYLLMADEFITNGVTVQEWISANEPPKDTCEYWIAYKAGGDYSYSTGYFDGKCWLSALTHHKIPVTHWMPLPHPPKGE